MISSAANSSCAIAPFIPERLFGIIGHPLGHTLSPLLHNWGFKRLGVQAAYVAFPTPPERLEAFIQAVRTLPLAGLSVTIPHKEAVMPLVDVVSELARRTGAVNTLAWEDGQLVGHNTDVEGFLAPLRANGCAPRSSPDSALVLGAGGAAKAVIVGLGEIGVEDITICNRGLERATALAGQFGVNAVAWERRDTVDAHLVVNTTPLGMASKAVDASHPDRGGEAKDASPMPDGFWTPDHLAYDLVYNPRETLFLRQAKTAGAGTIDGLSMFAAQGTAQFKLWTGLELPMDEAKELLAEALDLSG